jgi:transposase
LRLVQRDPKPDEEEKALACFGAVRQDTEQVYLYFSDGQPNSEHMWVFIVALLDIARQERKRVVVLIWDNASWHKSHRLKQWLRDHNRQAKAKGDVRLITHLLPTKSPWLNPIEPRWIHAKRGVCEPNGDLTPTELRRRISNHFNTEPLVNTFKE